MGRREPTPAAPLWVLILKRNTMKHLLFLIIATLPALAIETVTVPLEVAATGHQAHVSLSKLKGTVGFIMTAKSTDGTSPTAAIKLQSSPPPAVAFTIQTGTTDGVALRTDTDEAIKLATSFSTPNNAVTPSISRVIMPLKKHAGLTAGTLTVTIEAGASEPSGTPLQTATYNLAGLTAAYSGITFDFATPATLAANTKYWIVLAGDYTVHATNNVSWRKTTVASGGVSMGFDSAWVANVTTNLNHTTYQLVFSDVTGGGFVGATAVGTVQEITIPIQNFGSHFRSHVTIGGTSDPKFIIGIGAIQKSP